MEKEYKGIPRLRSTLNIKGKPRTKIQKGTYRRGRNLSKTTPISNNAQVLEATASKPPFQSESFDLDFADQLTVDDPLPGQPISELKVQQSPGSVLAPSTSQQEQYEAKSAQQYVQQRPASKSDGGNGQPTKQDSGNGLGSSRREATDPRGVGSGVQGGQSQGPGLGSNRQDDSNGLAARDDGDKGVLRQGPGSAKGGQNVSNAIATRDAAEQAAARVQEPVEGSEEQPQQGYSLMWYDWQPFIQSRCSTCLCRTQRKSPKKPISSCGL